MLSFTSFFLLKPLRRSRNEDDYQSYILLRDSIFPLEGMISLWVDFLFAQSDSHGQRSVDTLSFPSVTPLHKECKNVTLEDEFSTESSRKELEFYHHQITFIATRK